MNREDWLHNMVDRLAPECELAGHHFPKLAVSCGFPSRGALSHSKRQIGECWGSAQSASGVVNVFISPTLADGVRAADVLVHELCHAVLPPEAKHNKTFAALAKKMGLEGKPTATAASNALVASLSAHIAIVGPYPHSELTFSGGPKKQTTRMLKVKCPSCGYTVRLTRQWLDIGAPLCPTDANPLEEVMKNG